MDSVFTNALLAGEILKDELIIDAHAHMGVWYNFHIPENGTPASMVHSMDLVGINTSIVAPHICIGPCYLEGNRAAFQAAKDFPGRILPFVTVNPNYPESEVIAEIQHWEQEGIIGFKLHPQCHNADACHRNYYPVFEYCQERGLPILSHNWTGAPVNGKETLYGLAEMFPRITFIVGHALSGWGPLDTNCAAAKTLPNVMLDTTGSLLTYDAIPEAVRRVGAERIIWGTDNPFIDPRPGLGRMLMARITDDEKRLIMGLNAKRVFRL